MSGMMNLSVFTNAGEACSGADLLQQAFQDVVDDKERDNEFVAFFKDDEGQHQTIRLTQEQAAALGLTFEVDSLNDDTTNEVSHLQEEEHLLNDMETIEYEETLEEEQVEDVELPVGSEWMQTDLEDDNTGATDDLQEDQYPRETPELEANLQSKSMRAFVLQNLQHLKMLNRKLIQEDQALVPLGRAPIVPQPQFIVKPSQTILKTAKGIRLVSPTSKSSTPSPSRSINSSTNSMIINSGQKSMNGVHQVVGNGTMNQLINRNFPSVGNEVNVVLKTGQNPQRNQQLYPSAAKNLEGLRSVTCQGVNGKTGSLIKPVPVATQVVRTSASAVKISSTPQVLFKTTTGRLKPQDLKGMTNGVVRTQDVKGVGNGTLRHQEYKATTNGTVRSQNQLSVLKPQKVVLTNGNIQNGVVQTKKIINKVSSSPQRSCVDVRTIVQNFDPSDLQNRLISNDAKSVNEVKGFRKIEVSERPVPLLVPSVPAASAEEKAGNVENPIQIVQQGHTLHSNQKLTQSQLKQIAQVLQQRGQKESGGSREKVVYRVVFPEELDLRIRNPNTLLKAGRGKRGRPKKAPGRHVAAVKVGMTDEENDESKEDRKKVVARTRSGRLSRPPRHMVRDYKHLHPVDFMQPDLDDSDGGYSDYNTSTINPKLEGEETKELLTGLELPKRKVSTHFRCSTCNKMYLGRARLAKHFELFPEHGSIELLPSSTLTSNGCADELKKSAPLTVDSFKRKGKKRGPWAYVTPEAKSERRQAKLREALSVCDSGEISKIAAKPVINAQSLYDLMALKSDNNVKIFLNELKVFMEKIREQAGVMLSPIIDKEKEQNVIELRDELLCDALGLVPGVYSVNNDVFKKPEPYHDAPAPEEPPLKLQKVHNEEGKENIEERLSSGFSESSDLSVSDFLAERKQDPNCPEVLTALTLMPRNSSPVGEGAKNVSKLLISSAQIQRQMSDNPGFQKVDFNGSKSPTFKKIEGTNGLDLFEAKVETPDQGFIKLEPLQQSFIKLESPVGAYDKEEHLEKLENGFHGLDGAQSFTKGFQKIICEKHESLAGGKVNCKIQEGLPILQDAVPIISANCDASIFGGSDNLDPIGHLDYGVMDKHLMMDEKLVEQLHLVDQSNLVDELVSERLKNIIPDNILENNLMPNTTNLDTELDFEALSEEFNRNTRS